MTDSTQNAGHYQVADIEINAGTREVRRGSEVLDLPGLTFDLLLALVQAAPEVLSHDELEQRVWNGRAVSPETLTQRVKLVRDGVVIVGKGFKLDSKKEIISLKSEVIVEFKRNLVPKEKKK